MNTNLALIDSDKLYSERFLAAFEEFYPQIGVYLFSDIDVAVNSLFIRPVDILLVSESIYHIAKEKISQINCKAVIVLLNNKGLSMIDQYKTVCKFQRIDHLQQAVMEIYYNTSGVTVNTGTGSGVTRIITFMSGAGGSGCSTAAAAYACYLAQKKQNILYIDLNTFGMPDVFFSSEGSYTMTDCITAILNQKPNLGMQLKNFARRDSSGVYYYASCVNSLDWYDMDEKALITLIKNVAGIGFYDCLIIDATPGWNSISSFLAEVSSNVILVSECTTISNLKTQHLWDTAATYYGMNKKDTSQLYVLYCCYTDGSQKLTDDRVRELVSLPFISDYKNSHELVKKLSERNYWEM